MRLPSSWNIFVFDEFKEIGRDEVMGIAGRRLLKMF